MLPCLLFVQNQSSHKQSNFMVFWHNVICNLIWLTFGQVFVKV